MAKGDASVNELAEPFALTQAAISKHLKVLERAGLVVPGRDAQRRPRHLRAQPLRAAAEWLETYQQFWSGSYQRLDALLDELTQTADPTQTSDPSQSDGPTRTEDNR